MRRDLPLIRADPVSDLGRGDQSLGIGDVKGRDPFGAHPCQVAGVAAVVAANDEDEVERALVEQRGHAPMHLHEEAREAGWSDEQILEAIA